MCDVCRVLRSQGVSCNVELDDVIICAERKERYLRATRLAISILEHAGFKINYSKSAISPTQIIDYYSIILYFLLIKKFNLFLLVKRTLMHYEIQS